MKCEGSLVFSRGRSWKRATTKCRAPSLHTVAKYNFLSRKWSSNYISNKFKWFIGIDAINYQNWIFGQKIGFCQSVHKEEDFSGKKVSFNILSSHFCPVSHLQTRSRSCHFKGHFLRSHFDSKIMIKFLGFLKASISQLKTMTAIGFSYRKVKDHQHIMRSNTAKYTFISKSVFF